MREDPSGACRESCGTAVFLFRGSVGFVNSLLSPMFRLGQPAKLTTHESVNDLFLLRQLAGVRNMLPQPLVLWGLHLTTKMVLKSKLEI